MQINFFGDFVANNKEFPQLASDIKGIITRGDINIVNFEAVSIDKEEKIYNKINKTGPNLTQRVNAPNWIENNGFTAVSLSNNHIYDYGDDGLIDTKNRFKNTKTFGAGNWEEAYTPLVLNVKEKKIGFIGVTHCEFGTLTDKWVNKSSYGAAWINHPIVNNIIIDTKKKVDLLFIFAHAGVEHMEQPLPEWRDIYKSFIDLGADGVIASHPHIIQGWELYKNKPIVYSLGNFYFPKDNTKNKKWNKSIIASVDIDAESNISVKISPIHFDQNMISLDKSIETSKYLERINEILNNDQLYMSFINKTAISQQELFYTMFFKGGMTRSFTFKKIIRSLLQYSKMKNLYNPAWLYNNIQCESHRYLFLRGFKLTHKL